MIEKKVNLRLDECAFPERIRVSQFDTMWRFVFGIVNNSQPWAIPADASAVLNGRKPDGNVFAFSGTISDNKVTVDADVQMTAVAGQTVCELSILSGGKTVGTANFMLDVEAAPKSPDDVSSETTLPAYGEILDRIAEMEGGGGGGSVTVDDALSSTSENPVQNKAILAALDGKADLVGTALAENADLDTISNGVYYTHSIAVINSLVNSPIGVTPATAGMTLLAFGGIGSSGQAYQFQLAYDNTSNPATNPPRVWIRRATSAGAFSGAWQRLALASDVPPKVTEVTVATNGAVTLALEAGKLYHLTGALTDLTITLTAPASGELAQYHFDFTSGATAPSLTLPDSVVMPEGFSVEAKKRYEVDILNNYGAVTSWTIA